MYVNNSFITKKYVLSLAAIKQIKLLSEKNQQLKLRIFVKGGGCSGIKYGFTLDEPKDSDDIVIKCNDDIDIITDMISYQYIVGSEIDYQESVSGSKFIINNPNASTTCGCGQSFDITI